MVPPSLTCPQGMQQGVVSGEKGAPQIRSHAQKGLAKEEAQQPGSLPQDPSPKARLQASPQQEVQSTTYCVPSTAAFRVEQWTKQLLSSPQEIALDGTDKSLEIQESRSLIGIRNHP